jgi:hypothetical protein
VTAEEIVRLVDALEDKAAGYLTLDDVQRAAGEDLGWAIEDNLLLVDYRTRLDGANVTLCRLNRRHATVVRLTSW